jgi:hypothetical protein
MSYKKYIFLEPIRKEIMDSRGPHTEMKYQQVSSIAGIDRAPVTLMQVGNENIHSFL